MGLPTCGLDIYGVANVLFMRKFVIYGVKRGIR
jgi:hypothetical protein